MAYGANKLVARRLVSLRRNGLCGILPTVILVVVMVVAAGLVLADIHTGDAVPFPVEASLSPEVDGVIPAMADTSDLAAAFERGWPLALLVIFLIGLALNLTPCVYPMLAVTVSIFGAQTEKRSARVFVRALMYVLGIASMYSVLGVAAALTGGLFGGILQSRAVLIGIALLFGALALSMFGLYELRLPAAWMDRLGGTRQAGLAGTYLSGLLVGVFAAPCIGPPIIALLAMVGQRADAVFGFVVFFVLSLGLGAPYLVLGTFSGLLQKLPRSGEWMIWVRKLFGIILIGVAGFYLSLAWRPELIFVFIPLTLIAGGFYLGFMESSQATGRWFAWLKRGVGLVAVLAGIGFFMSGRKPSLEWPPYTARDLSDTQRPAILYFSADWCIPCLELDRRTFTDQDVIRGLNRFALFKVDLTNYDAPESLEVRQRYGIVGVPTMVFLDAAGNEMPAARRVGFVAAPEMLDHLDRVRAMLAAPSDAPGQTMPAWMQSGTGEPLPSTARLVADVEWIQPGVPFRAGVLFQMQDHWHVYWINPGDSGTPPQIDWRLPDGFDAGPVAWPFPQRFDDGPFATFGHEEQLLLARSIRPPADTTPGTTVTLTADAAWLVCKDICIAQNDGLSLQIEVRDEPPVPSARWHALFEETAARAPVADPAWAFAVAPDGGGYLLTVTPPADRSPEVVMASEFFPLQPGFLRTSPTVWQRKDAGVQRRLVPEGPVPDAGRLQGVLVLPETVQAEGRPRALLVDLALTNVP